MNKSITALSLVAVLVASGAVVFLQNNKKPIESDVSTLNSAQQSASKAYIDPATGELTSKPPVGSTLATTGNSKLVLPSNSAMKPVEVIHHSNGMTQIKLNGHGRSNTRVSVDCNSPAVVEYLKEKSLDITDCEAVK